MSAKLYAERDSKLLGEGYVKHVMAMTAEGLHAKSDIAAELAIRDAYAEQLEAERDRLAADCAVKDEALKEAQAVLIGMYDPQMEVSRISCIPMIKQALTGHPGGKLLAVVEAARILEKKEARYRHLNIKLGPGRSEVSMAWSNMRAAGDKLRQALSALDNPTGAENTVVPQFENDRG